MRAFFFYLAWRCVRTGKQKCEILLRSAKAWRTMLAPLAAGDSAPSVGVTYAYRLLPPMDVEAGIDTALSLGSEARGANYDIKANDRFIWVPFGLRGVLPLRRDRVEISIGAGGTYEKYSASDSLFVPRNGWGGYASVGAAVALDGRRHFWLGASPHLFFVNADRGYAHDRWLSANLGLGLRF